jgi:hypothetical protein
MEDRRLQENPNRKQKRTETKNKGKVVVVDGVLPFRDKTLHWNATCLETSTTKGKATLGVAGLCPVTNRRSKIPR